MIAVLPAIRLNRKALMSDTSEHRQVRANALGYQKKVQTPERDGVTIEKKWKRKRGQDIGRGVQRGDGEGQRVSERVKTVHV